MLQLQDLCLQLSENISLSYNRHPNDHTQLIPNAEVKTLHTLLPNPLITISNITPWITELNLNIQTGLGQNQQ